MSEEKREDWCYIHNEEKDCYNEDGDHDDYHCRKCEKNKKIDVMNLKNISQHFHEIEAFLMHAYRTEKDTAVYILISLDKEENEIKRSSFLNFTKEYREPYQTK